MKPEDETQPQSALQAAQREFGIADAEGKTITRVRVTSKALEGSLVATSIVVDADSAAGRRETAVLDDRELLIHPADWEALLLDHAASDPSSGTSITHEPDGYRLWGVRVYIAES